MTEIHPLEDQGETQPPPPPSPKAKSAGGQATTIGDFRLLKKLGAGGMGTVYKAEQTSLDRIVALKVLSRDLAAKPGFVERFLREARMMAKLDHLNVLRFYELRETKGMHYLVMEFAEGGSVASWLAKLGKFSVGDALHLVL